VNKKIILTLVIAIMLSSMVFSVSTTRSVNESVEVGKEITIAINLDLEGEDPSSVIVLEKIPENWELVNSNPGATMFEGEMKWLLFGSSLKNQTIEYTLKAPANFDYVSLNGGWKTLVDTGSTTGDEMILKFVPQPETPVGEPMDYTILIIGAIVLVVIVVIAVVVMKKKKK